jgi:hypothetical protein
VNGKIISKKLERFPYQNSFPFLRLLKWCAEYTEIRGFTGGECSHYGQPGSYHRFGGIYCIRLQDSAGFSETVSYQTNSNITWRHIPENYYNVAPCDVTWSSEKFCDRWQLISDEQRAGSGRPLCCRSAIPKAGTLPESGKPESVQSSHSKSPMICFMLCNLAPRSRVALLYARELLGSNRPGDRLSWLWSPLGKC